MNAERRLTILIVLFVLLSMFVRTSWAGLDAKMIDTDQLHSMIVDNAYKLEAGRKNRFMLIDARTREEYSETHIFSAISIPQGDFEKSAYLLPEDKNTLIVIYDNGINSRTSMHWVDKAVNAGYTNCVIYSDGLPVWKKQYKPTAPLKETR